MAGRRPIGIDLGTTRTVCAYVDEHGVPRVCSSMGEALVPSVVLFQDGQALVGQVAKDSRIASPESVVELVKRQMGNDDWRFAAGDKEYTAVEVSSCILAEAKRIAGCIGDEAVDAVVTVPAYFYDKEIKRTRQAGERAGLRVLRMISEPTAAAIAYGSEVHASGEDQTEQRVLVYDLGGGTFDCTIMKLSGSRRDVLSVGGNQRLGGADWDELLVDYMADAFVETHGVDPRYTGGLYALREQAENVKIQLSTREKATLTCHHMGKSLARDVTRAQFEAMSQGLMGQTEEKLDETLAEAGLTDSDIDLTLLVGGSTRMPMVEKQMQARGWRYRRSSKPDYDVAIGAALEAARLSGDSGELYKPAARRVLKGMTIEDCVPHGLGVLSLDGSQCVNAEVIAKGAPIPATKSRDDFTTNRDGQTEFEVHLVQGEETEPLACVPVATYVFSGLPPRKAGETRVRLTYSYDADRTVDVTATDVRTKKDLDRREAPVGSIMDIVERLREVEIEPESRPIAIAFLLDTSISMRGALNELKGAFEEFVRGMDLSEAKLGLIQFGEGSRASVEESLCDDADRLIRTANKLTVGGTTPMAEALELAVDMLGEEDDGSSDRYIVLFTDGQPNDRDRTISAGLRAREAGIRILCQGLDHPDMDVLDQLATDKELTRVAGSGQELSRDFGNIARLISGRRV